MYICMSKITSYKNRPYH